MSNRRNYNKHIETIHNKNAEYLTVTQMWLKFTSFLPQSPKLLRLQESITRLSSVCVCVLRWGWAVGEGVDLKKLVFSSHYIDPEAQTQVKTSA